MSRRVKEFIDIGETIRRSMSLSASWSNCATGFPTAPSGAQASWGRGLRAPNHHHLLPRSDGRGSGAREALRRGYARGEKRELERLQQELGVVCYSAPGKRGKLRSSRRRSGGAEPKRETVHAVAQPRRLWAIVEHVPKMAAATGARALRCVPSSSCDRRE